MPCEDQHSKAPDQLAKRHQPTTLEFARRAHVKCVTALVACTLLVTLLLISSVSVKANTLTFFETRYNTDVTAAGVGGLRGAGTGTITLGGVNGTVTKAYLYWNGVTNSNDPNFDANVTVNGAAVAGTNIGFSHDNVWGF